MDLGQVNKTLIKRIMHDAIMQNKASHKKRSAGTKE